jgi:gamma-glutamyltranspeptidase / glutathione hydrolase
VDNDCTFRSRRSNVLGMRGMVAASQPLAAQTGLEILRLGGNAADAAIATAAMLNVLEPMFTGVGGDCFALYYDAHSREVSALNGSGRAPRGASIEVLRQQDCTEVPPYLGCAVSVPGCVAGWSDLLERYGRASLHDVLQPAIRTAENGYPVAEIVALEWEGEAEKLLRTPSWRERNGVAETGVETGPVGQPSGNEMLVDGRAPEFGEVMTLPTLAETLHGIAASGRDYVYKGDFAKRLSKYVQRYGGWITPADMAAHTSTWEQPISTDYRGHTLHECPPNGQGLAAIIGANLATGFDIADLNKVDRLHILIECMRLAMADAQRWVTDPQNMNMPLDILCSKEYAARRRTCLDLSHAKQHVVHGDPDASSDTVYLSVVDGEGNACSFINSVFYGWGSGLIVPDTGVVLQNRAATFSLDPAHTNALAGGKRTYHTIIPAMLTVDGELRASFGVMGGYMQPHGHLQMLVNLLDLRMSPQQALNVPRWRLAIDGGGVGALDPGGLVFLEDGWDFRTLAALTRRGHRVAPVDGLERHVFGGGQIILRDPQTRVLTGGSEPRQDGHAVGF